MIALPRSPTLGSHFQKIPFPSSVRELKSRLHIILAFFFVLFFIFSWSIYLPHRSRGIYFRNSHPKDLVAIYNETLGFEKIYALALPDRKDRATQLQGAGNATNLTITILNAVRDAEIAKETWPSNWKEEDHTLGELGCLVSHVRTWNKILSDNITTALVLESDADWDLRIHDIMAPFPHAISALTDFTSWRSLSPLSGHHPSPSVPYGLNWDIIWMGHCGSNAVGAARIFGWNDTTVPPEEKEFVFDIGLQDDQHIPGTRTMFEFARTTCSTGYAISRRGAERLVGYFKDADANLDLQLSAICTKHADLVCMGVWPQVFTNAASASNIQHSGDGDAVNVGESQAADQIPSPGPAIQFSARKNAANLKEGKSRDEWYAEWDTMWQPAEYDEEKKAGLGDGSWIPAPLNRTVAFSGAVGLE